MALSTGEEFWTENRLVDSTFRLRRLGALVVLLDISLLLGCSAGFSNGGSGNAQDFAISVSPATITANAGGSSSAFTISTTAQNGFSGSVTMAISGLPAGATTSPAFPFSMSMSQSQAVTVSDSASTGSFPLTVTGTSGSLTHSASLTLTVNAAYTAASCSVEDINTQVALAVAGDTVIIPPGTCTWTTTLTVPTAINLIGSDPVNPNTVCTSSDSAGCGSAGGGTTVIIDNVSKASCTDNPAIFMNISAQLPWRLSGFTVQGMAADTGSCSEHISAVTNSHAFRIDNITLQSMTSTGIHINGDAWGLVDHSSFAGNHQRGVFIEHATWQQIGAFGDNSWAQPSTMGTQEAVYVEDCFFAMTAQLGAGEVASQNGGRAVFRNSSGVSYVGTHGTDSTQRNRGVRHFEVYNNVVTDVGNGAAVTQLMQLRSGTGLFFNNQITGNYADSYAGLFVLEEYREATAWAPFGAATNPIPYNGTCDGTGPFDNNSGMLYASGTDNAATNPANVLTDTTKSWAINQWASSATGWYSIHNITQGWGTSIASNTATTITMYSNDIGTPYTWNNGDSYEVLSVYPCLDQPGRGQGTYLSGGTLTTPPTPTGWPSEASEPAYEWGNVLNGTEVPAIDGGLYTHTQPNRDYYTWTSSFNGTSGTGTGLLSARPSTCTPFVGYWATDTSTLYQCSATNTWTTYYTPYTYPHPLQGVPQ